MIEFERGHAYVVDRGETQLRYGQGMAEGLGVVIRHFRDAFTKKLNNASETSGVFTVQYPEERLKLPDAFRNFPILLYDDESGQEFCTSCFQCERICPPQVIHITQEKDSNTGKPVPAAAEFLIEYDACMSCGLCAEVCPFDAIKMDHAFELSTDEHGSLTINRAGLDRPVSYYEQLAPSFWAEAKDNAYKKLQGTLKRRSGLIGIAPQMRDRIVAADDTTAYKRAVGASPAGAAQPPADDKAARLAAIRARNAAKNAHGDDTPTDNEAAYKRAAGVPQPPADDKAARLAAIRARNAAKNAHGDDNTPTDDEAAYKRAAGAFPADAPATDDKAARLAAIRAANIAKKASADDTTEAAYRRAAGVSPVEVPPANDKAARLAAIRAANAAKKVEANGTSALAPQAPQIAAPADDKAARLAAIRAANAAKKAEQALEIDRQEPVQAAPADDKAARLTAIRAANAAKKAAQTTQGDSHDSPNGTNGAK